MKRALFIIAVLLLSGWYYWQHPLTTRLKIGAHVFTVDLAVTPYEKSRGLSGRVRLLENDGMLFVYDHKEQYEFWMKDMQFPLDFIWIDGKIVVDLTTNVPALKPGEAPVRIKPHAEVDKILEVNAGTVERLKIKIGDRVEFLN